MLLCIGDNVYADITRKNWSELFLTLYSENIKSSTLEFLSESIEIINAKNFIFETLKIGQGDNRNDVLKSNT